MNIKRSLRELNLGYGNSVVIGSGILNAYKIRQSNDIDVVVTFKEYSRLSCDKRFIEKNKHGCQILTFDLFEVGTRWEVLGVKQTFDDLRKQSVIIDNVSYISLDFLLAVKKSWLNKNDVRQKDIDDVALIEKYMRELDLENPDCLIFITHVLACSKRADYHIEMTVRYEHQGDNFLELEQIERRFRLTDVEFISEDSLSQYPSIEISQGYITHQDGSEVRVRSVNNGETYTLTEKQGNGLRREWRERIIKKDEYNTLWLQTEGSRVTKTRYFIPVGDSEDDDLVIELDFFRDDLQDFVIAEVKFGDEGRAKCFNPPSWLVQAGLVEVTEITAFQNKNLSRYQSYESYLSRVGEDDRSLPDIEQESAERIFDVLMDATKHIYGLYRKEERQIFGNASGHGPQETDAEHSWHIELLLDILWTNREEFEIDFGEGFDIGLAMDYARIHDLPEIWAKDVDASTKNSKLLRDKDKRELEAVGLMVAGHSYLGNLALRSLEYSQKQSPESKLVSDIDKFVGMLMIIHDDGAKWREQHGNTTSRDRHDLMISKKLKTPFGRKVLGVFMNYFDQNPTLFAKDTVKPMVPENIYGDKSD